MPGLVPGIHELNLRQGTAWMAGTSPAMTRQIRRYLHALTTSAIFVSIILDPP
jgi:hypothetical protein